MRDLRRQFNQKASAVRDIFREHPGIASFLLASYVGLATGLGYLAHFGLEQTGLLWGSSWAFDDEPRPLTDSEIEYASRVFGDEIDYEALRIATSPMKFGVLGQAWWNQIRMYYPATCRDYGADNCSHSIKQVFMHEVTHSWQLQHFGMTDFYDHYDYRLNSESRFGDFFMEQQGAIIEDYTRIFLYPDQEGCKPLTAWDRFVGRDDLQRVVYEQFPSARAYCEFHAPS